MKKTGKQNKLTQYDKWLIYGVALYHIGLGIFGMVFKNFAIDIARMSFNFNLTMTPEIYWIINPFASYILVFGMFMWIAAQDPVKYKKVLYVGVFLFGIRIIQRIWFMLTADTALKVLVDPIQNMLHLLIVTVLGVWMYKVASKV